MAVLDAQQTDAAPPPTRRRAILITMSLVGRRLLRV
jgi:hypothetical protein